MMLSQFTSIRWETGAVRVLGTVAGLLRTTGVRLEIHATQGVEPDKAAGEVRDVAVAGEPDEAGWLPFDILVPHLGTVPFRPGEPVALVAVAALTWSDSLVPSDGVTALTEPGEDDSADAEGHPS